MDTQRQIGDYAKLEESCLEVVDNKLALKKSHSFYGNESHYLTHKEPVKWVKLENQLTGFYMRARLALNGLNYKCVENNRLSFYYQR